MHLRWAFFAKPNINAIAIFFDFYLLLPTKLSLSQFCDSNSCRSASLQTTKTSIDIDLSVLKDIYLILIVIAGIRERATT